MFKNNYTTSHYVMFVHLDKLLHHGTDGVLFFKFFVNSIFSYVKKNVTDLLHKESTKRSLEFKHMISFKNGIV